MFQRGEDYETSYSIRISSCFIDLDTKPVVWLWRSHIQDRIWRTSGLYGIVDPIFSGSIYDGWFSGLWRKCTAMDRSDHSDNGTGGGLCSGSGCLCVDLWRWLFCSVSVRSWQLSVLMLYWVKGFLPPGSQDVPLFWRVWRQRLWSENREVLEWIQRTVW